MGNKSVQKRKYILDKARNIFCENGYRTVTMKDIVEACDISRGGLYLYFSNTKELFEAVLEEEIKDIASVLEEKGTEQSTPGEMMFMYLNEQKKLILKKKDNLVIAIYEYMFENKPPKNDNLVISQFNTTVDTLEKIITDGVAQEWMVCEDAAEAARNIAYTLEGLKISAQAIDMSESTVDEQIAYIMGTLGMELE